MEQKQQDGMKRFFKYNSSVAIAFVLLWALIDIIIVKIRPYSFVVYTAYASLALVFLAFFFVSWRALRDSSKHPVGFAALSSIVMSPVFIGIGIIFIKSFRHLIGGDY
jgi:hypothetical protein